MNECADAYLAAIPLQSLNQKLLFCVLYSEGLKIVTGTDSVIYISADTMSNLQLVLVTQTAKNITPQRVDMRVPLYSAGCERKIRNALSHIKGLYSIDADLANQKVTVIGIVDREEVLAAIRTKRKDAHFLNEELCRIDKVSDPSPQYVKTRTSNGTLPIDVSNLRAATTSAVKSIKRSIVKKISFRGRS